MSKIITFSKDRKRKQEKKEEVIQEDKRAFDIEHCRELLNAKISILDELVYVTEDILSRLGYESSDFILNQESAVNFVKSDIVEFMRGGRGNLSLEYDAVINEEVLKVHTSAVPREGQIGIEVLLLKWDEENKEWLFYNGKSWQRGPGK